ncbi:MAG: hypothetical protein WC969_05920 [Elusimicrobiota bacterium]|jgi:hypothetical protein
MNKPLRFLLAAAVLALADPAAAAPRSFEGEWSTSYGDMTLHESSASVRGSYTMGGAACAIEGRRAADELIFAYQEPDASGQGRFRLSADGESFEGERLPRGGSAWNPWKGRRRVRAGDAVGFEGLWQTDFGRLRLSRSGERVLGYYSFSGGSLEGRVRDGALRFRYSDQKKGEGEFRLSEDGSALRGRWRADGAAKWSDWNGTRVEPAAGRRWLVVLESRWESDLSEREYSYGDMLKVFFTRTPAVQVRHRFYTDKASLAKWVREASLLAEPVVLYFSAHGSEEGLHTDSGPADADALTEPLRVGTNIELVHFGACEVMKGKVPAELQRRLASGPRFPISGFAQTVDWAASAVADFMYLDLILSRGLPPAKAAAELERLMPFTTRTSAGSSYDGVSFRLLGP